MKFQPPLHKARLVRRYKRFLADVELGDGTQCTVHCPNTGAMLGCSEPGSDVWLSTATNPRRKYPQTLEQVASGADQIGVNPMRANALVAEALDNGVIRELQGVSYRREVAVPGGHGRFDFGLGSGSAPNDPATGFVEVKSVTLGYPDGTGAFPDAVSERALRHVRALQDCAATGQRAVLLFCVQHTGVVRMRCAAAIHPEYARAVAQAATAGVEVLAYGCVVTPAELALVRPLPVVLEP